MSNSGKTTKILLSILTLVFLLSCSGKVELLQGVSESEANEALAALIDAGIPAGKLPGKEGTVGIEVESFEVARAIAILRSEGLPKERYAKMGEVFRKEGLISSPLEERARYLWALSQELSATISQIDGVIKARVHVVLPERGSGGDPVLPSSAAVFIKHKSGVVLDDSLIQIKKLVANSIPGLAVDKVTVILLPSSVRKNSEIETNSIKISQANENLQKQQENKDYEKLLSVKELNIIKDFVKKLDLVAIISIILLLIIFTTGILYRRKILDFFSGGILGKLFKKSS